MLRRRHQLTLIKCSNGWKGQNKMFRKMRTLSDSLLFLCHFSCHCFGTSTLDLDFDKLETDHRHLRIILYSKTHPWKAKDVQRRVCTNIFQAKMEASLVFPAIPTGVIMTQRSVAIRCGKGRSDSWNAKKCAQPRAIPALPKPKCPHGSVLQHMFCWEMRLQTKGLL